MLEGWGEGDTDGLVVENFEGFGHGNLGLEQRRVTMMCWEGQRVIGSDIGICGCPTGSESSVLSNTLGLCTVPSLSTMPRIHMAHSATCRSSTIMDVMEASSSSSL